MCVKLACHSLLLVAVQQLQRRCVLVRKSHVSALEQFYSMSLDLHTDPSDCQVSTSQTSSQIPVTGPGARQPGAVCAVQEQRFNDLLGLNLADLKRRCSSVGVTTSDKSSKPQLQAALLHFMTRHMDKAPARSLCCC